MPVSALSAAVIKALQAAVSRTRLPSPPPQSIISELPLSGCAEMTARGQQAAVVPSAGDIPTSFEQLNRPSVSHSYRAGRSGIKP